MARVLLRHDRPPLTAMERALIREKVSAAARERIERERERSHFKGTRAEYWRAYKGEIAA